MADDLTDALDDALEALLRARMLTGTFEVRHVPVMALDAALARNGDYAQAKGRAMAALRRLLDAVPVEHRELVFAVESAIREESSLAIDVAFSVGMTAATAGRR